MFGRGHKPGARYSIGLLTAILVTTAFASEPSCAQEASRSATAPASPGERQTPIKIGVLAKRGAERCLEKWVPTAEYLTSQVPGHSFTIVPFDFEEVDPTVERGEVDFILANPGFYVGLEKLYGANRIATLKNRRTAGAYTVFGGVIFCRADREDIQDLEDLKGKTFMATNENSFGGWQMAWRELKERRIDPHHDFSGLTFGGTHDAVVYAVRDGKVDAGTVRTDTLERMAAEGKIRLEDFRALRHDHIGEDVCEFPFLHSTDMYPEWPMAELAHTSNELAEKVAIALVGMPADSPAAQAAMCAGWTVPLNYQPVHDCLRELRVGPYKDYGKITVGDVLKAYWPWITLGLVLLAGTITSLVWTLRLLSQRKRAEDELRESNAMMVGALEREKRAAAKLEATMEQLKQAKEAADAAREAATRETTKLRSMIEGMDEGIVVADADDIITEVNKWFLDKVGLKRDDIVGKSLWELHPKTEGTARVRAALETFRSGQCRETLVVNRELLGMQLSLRAQPIVKGDCYHGAILNVINVTDFVEARQAAEVATRSKSEFLANMSHEIRTPMTAILGFTETMLDRDISDSERLNAVHTVRRNGEHLLQIINDILDISKIEAGKLEVERIECSPIQVVADVKSLMQVRADAKKLPFNIEYIGAVPETIQSDQTRLKQILVNLIGNAIKFTETGGVRLVTRFVDTDPIGGTGPAEPMLQFDVVDSGLGMTEEQTGRLFQAFSQADTSTTRKFGGTGLGLMISKRLSEMLGGDITVESKPGEGSTFRVTITTGSLDGVKMLDDPMSATIVTPDETAATPSVDQPALEGRRILLAEDGPDNQRLIGHFLKKAGAEVTVKDNGKLAAEAALAARDEGKPFDVILMDMQMPVMDGYEATGLLRQKGYTGPIIALTAHAMAGDRDKCITAGCDDYASKPIDRAKLIETIRQAINAGVPTGASA